MFQVKVASRGREPQRPEGVTPISWEGTAAWKMARKPIEVSTFRAHRGQTLPQGAKELLRCGDEEESKENMTRPRRRTMEHCHSASNDVPSAPAHTLISMSTSSSGSSGSGLTAGIPARNLAIAARCCTAAQGQLHGRGQEGRSAKRMFRQALSLTHGMEQQAGIGEVGRSA